MATPSIADAALSVGGRIGRYFSLTSVLPSLFLVLWVYVLFVGNPWSGSIDFSGVVSAFGSWSISDVAWFLVVTLAAALFTHALQLPITQALEGYWPATGLAGRMQLARVRKYRRDYFRQLHRIGRDQDDLERETEEVRESSYPEDSLDDQIRNVLWSESGEPFIAYILRMQESFRRKDRFPDSAGRILPTRLGNILRRYEDRAGKKYGLDAITVVPHLLMIAPQRHVDYVNDMRQSLDTSVRLCSVSFVATLAAVVALLPTGWWLLLALFPYMLAYLAYRGSVSSATYYGLALCMLIDLDRFALYESLRLPAPSNLRDERQLNYKLDKLLRSFNAQVEITYTHPAQPSVDGA
jgi:hypothetical protein